MTESEAIKELHEIRPRGGIIPQMRAEAIDMAINALDKQIPKKLIKWANGTEHCPTCDCDNSCVGYGVCINCGQKLDFGE